MSLLPHLRRLDRVWVDAPIYFITTAVEDRRPVLACPAAADALRAEFVAAPARHGWTVGRYVVMPDHLHFFCAAGGERHPVSLSDFVGRIKQWSAKAIMAELSLDPPLWQREFFDHVLRSDESYDNKWRYVVENPVRAGLVARAVDWPFSGEVAPLAL
ncbi:MAG: REP-associated tyrosine transposase [Roseiarcus sp.]